MHILYFEQVPTAIVLLLNDMQNSPLQFNPGKKFVLAFWKKTFPYRISIERFRSPNKFSTFQGNP